MARALCRPLHFLRSIGDTVIRQSHTPGPWLVNSNHVMDASGRFIVAEVNYGMPEHDANVHLIAAAPKLLDTIRDVLEMLTVQRPEIGCQLPATVATLRDAIADLDGSE